MISTEDNCAERTVHSFNYLIHREYSFGWRRGFFWGSSISTVTSLFLWALLALAR